MNAADTLLIGPAFQNGPEDGILTVAKRIDGEVKIINAFEGKEAWDIYQKLITVTNPKLKKVVE